MAARRRERRRTLGDGGASMAAWIRTCVAAVACTVAIEPASAVDLNKSRLTSVDLTACKRQSRHADGGAWLCPGLRGYPVYFAEGDLRQMMAFGPSPRQRRSATQTFGAFNTIFAGKRRPTIEWRVESMADGRVEPFATIVRYYTSREGEKGEALVITKVTPKESCRLAVIDARGNEDAMVMARSWANAEARKRTCPETPEVLGKPGKGPL